jgi:hypothetical protein
MSKNNHSKIRITALAVFLLALFFSVCRLYFPGDGGKKDMNAKITTPAGKVLGEGEESYPAEMRGEKNRLPQVAFGGGLTAFFPGLGEPLGPLDIENTQSEIVRTKEKKELQLVAKWTTRRPIRCTVEFGKSGGAAKSVEEEFFAIEHSAVLENLDSSSTYFYSITARDKLGGETVSEKFAVYTGAPDVSFFDLLAGAFKDAFGWAVK